MARSPGSRSIVDAWRKASPTMPMRRSELKRCAVIGDDARRLLPAMLKGVQAERGDRRSIGMAENAEHAAFLAQPVGVQIEIAEGFRVSARNRP